MDTVEKELSILMSEKEQADKQIGSYLELQVKVHTLIFTAGAVAAGWIFAQNKGEVSSGDVRGAAVLALAFLGSFATLQGVVNYGIVLGYIRYKHLVVGRRMQDLLGLDRNPLTALRAISSSSSNRIVMASSFFGGVFILGASGGLLGYALSLWREGKVASSLFPGGLLACAVLWLGTVVSGLGLARSMVILQRETERAKSQRYKSVEPSAPEFRIDEVFPADRPERVAIVRLLVATQSLVSLRRLLGGLLPNTPAYRETEHYLMLFSLGLANEAASAD
jgi:hypothetical protein